MKIEGLLIQKGSFNPLHRMHKRIADDAIAHYPDYPHTMCLSIKTCDKGENTPEEIMRRSKLINEAGYQATYDDTGLFIDTIKEVRSVMPKAKIVFPVGEDTLYRFIRDWDRYYTEKHPDEYLRRFTDYEKEFDNVEWYVSKRDCPEKEQFGERVRDYTHYYSNIVWSGLDLDDISSSKIRAGVPNE